MSRPFSIEITESEKDLKKCFQHVWEATHKEKFQMLWWLKSGQVTQQQEIGKCFQVLLDWLSQPLGADWAILQVNQAPVHMTSAIRWTENMIPLGQPAHSPELNPIEQFWQLLKQALKNQSFPSLQVLRERVQELFDQLTLEQVMSVSSYYFILEALL
mgnify:CR=1 FL=1